MIKENKNSVYVVRQPTKSIVTLILVEEENLPFSENIHKILDKLQTITDLFFVFSDRFGSSKSNERKLTNLYRGCSYIRGSSKCINKPLVDSLVYCKEIFKCHFSYLITSVSKLNTLNINQFSLDRLNIIQELAASGIKSPILIMKRLSSIDLGKIYSRDNNWNNKNDNNRFWSTMKSETPIIMISNFTISNILNYILPDKINFIESFTETDFSYFIASTLDYLEIENLEGDVMDLDINKLTNEKRI